MDYAIELAEIEAQDTAVVRGHVGHDGVGDFLGAALGQVMAAVGQTAVSGPPFARYDMADDGWDMEAGFPVAAPFADSGDVVGSSLPAGQVARTVHEGPYQELGGAYMALEQWIAAQGMVPTGPPWEVYLNDPHEQETPRTLVVWPCRPNG